MRASEIYAPVRDSLDRVERNLLDVSRLEFPFLAELLGHVLASRGKRLRPTIALLASRFSEHDHETTEKMATAVELLHIASLIHDDTVDGSATRHGRATISSVWGRDVAVQTGDYVFASAAALVCETGNIRVIRRFSQTIMDLATGQLREVAETHDPDGTREDYMARIYAKTASLFVVAAEAGAALSGASVETVEAMSNYGRSLGLAFQIVDDILDFEGVEDHIGKPVGSDLANGVLTLPAIIAMERSPNGNPVRDLFRDPGNERYLREAVVMVQDPAVIKDAYAVARSYCDSAHDSLKAVPVGPERESLSEIVDYVLERSK